MLKKVLLFIVEGLSDKDALEPIIDPLIDNKVLHYEVLRCDATASENLPYQNKNMKQRIKIIIDNFLQRNHGIKKEHIEKIIYITDTDGCYIADDFIHYSKSDTKFRYENDGIYTNKPERAISRNHKKSQNLNVLSSSTTIYHLPIETYYFSCNLDHVLHNIRNLEQDKKEELAIAFAEQYENEEIKFLNFIAEKIFSLGQDYKSSWDEIKNDLNSLIRYTNFKLFFFNNVSYFKSDIQNKINTLYTTHKLDTP